MKFKMGDKVKVKEKIACKGRKGDPICNCFIGKIGEISSFEGENIIVSFKPEDRYIGHSYCSGFIKSDLELIFQSQYEKIKNKIC